MSLILTNKEIAGFISIEAIMEELIKSGKSDTFILIVPTNRKIRELKREILHTCPNKISSLLQIFTIDLFIKQIYNLSNKGKFYLDVELQSVFFEETIIRLFKEKKLKYFNPRPDYKMPRGTFEKVMGIISEFKEKGIMPEDLEKDFEYINEREIAKVEDLIQIYRSYNELLGNKFIDKGSVYSQINNDFKSPFHNDIFYKYFTKVKNIFIYGFSEFSKPEIIFLNTLSTLENISVLFDFDYDHENPFLFGYLKDNVSNFYSNLREFITASSFDDNFKIHLTKNLFNRIRPKNKKDFSDKVTFFSTKDRIEEVETIFKIIRQILIDNPLQDPSKICIATYSTEKYTNLFREISRKYNIPVNITDRFNLSNSPVISSIVAFLEIPLNNYRRKDIFRALLSPYLKFTKPDGNIIDSSNLFNIANSLKILQGKEVWLQKIDRRMTFLNDLISNGNEDDIESIAKEIKSLKIAKEDFEFLKSYYVPFPKTMEPNKFIKELIVLLKKLKVSEQLLITNKKNAEFETTEKDIRAVSQFLSILTDLKNIYEFKNETRKKHSISFYLDDLKIAVSNSRYNIKQRYGNGVFITSAEETRGLKFDYLFLAGMVEGDFPITFRSEIFKPEIRRKTEESHLLENRYLFYQTITNFSKGLFISYPKFQNDIELLQSSFLISLKEIIKSNETLPTSITKNIYSKPEFQKFIGKTKIFNPEKLPEMEHYSIDFQSIQKRMDIQDSREKYHSLKHFEGDIKSDLEPEQTTEMQKITKKEFSISALEEYGKCPMKYFFNRILNLEVFQEEDDDISAMELGSIIHECLFEFYHRKKVTNDEIAFPLKDEDLNQSTRELRDIAIEKIAALNITNPFFKIDFEKIIGDGIRKKGFLRRFLEYENSEDKIDHFIGTIYKPKYFEVSFGKLTGSKKYSDIDLSTPSSIEINNIKIRGKVDRIDLIENNDNLYFLIFDYKTGRVPDARAIEEGMSLQIPIYLIAMQKLLLEKSRKPIIPIGGIYYLLQSRIELKPALVNKRYFKSKSLNLKDDDAFASSLNKSMQYIKNYVENISDGKFRLPLEKKDLEQVCKYCNFKAICRIQSVKVFNFSEE